MKGGGDNFMKGSGFHCIDMGLAAMEDEISVGKYFKSPLLVRKGTLYHYNPSLFLMGGLTIGSCWQSGVTFDRKPAGTRLHVTQPSNPRSPFDLSAHVPHALPQPQDFFPLTNWPWIYISAAHILVSKLFQVKAEEGGVVDRPTQLIFVWLFYLLYICQHTKKEGEGGEYIL